MFDIDGTLVDSTGFDSELYAEAVESELGFAIDRDWNHYEHVSDSGILDELLRKGGRDADLRAEIAARVQRHFVARVREHLVANPATVREIAGARRLIERLRMHSGLRVAVATGGWEESARLKLAHVGIDADALAFASGSDARARTAIMRIAEQRALRGARLSRATYFGDGPWDRRASEELGYEFVAVGNGVPHRVRYADLQDLDAILAQLEAAPSGGVSST